MTQSILALNLGFHWQMTHVEYASDVIHLNHIEQWKSSPHITLDWEVENV